ncbi:MAG: hypothetical protein R3F46_14090 [bacterium]
MRFHLTRKLAAAIKCDLQTAPAAETPAPQGNWYANIYTQDRRPRILFVHEASLLALLCYKRGVTDGRSLAAAFDEALRGYLGPVGLLEPYLLSLDDNEALSNEICRTGSRSVLGVMNEYIFMSRDVIDDNSGNFNLYMMEYLNVMPMGPLKMARPCDRFIEILSARLARIGGRLNPPSDRSDPAMMAFYRFS